MKEALPLNSRLSYFETTPFSFSTKISKNTVAFETFETVKTKSFFQFFQKIDDRKKAAMMGIEKGVTP